jgi:acetyl-CoA acetyltransferase
LFFDLKVGFWVAMGVPVSMLGTGALMFAADQTLNMLSMFAFLMAVGIDVDDAIVVSDNVERHRKMGKGPIEVAEVHAPFGFQELIVAESLGLDASTEINPSGGALASHAVMVAGIIRIGEAANQITKNGKNRTLAHATSGPCLQQNLVCVLEGDQ